MNLRQNFFLITGASTGIGRALSLHFAGRGLQVYAGVRSEKDFKELSALKEKLPSLHPLYLDVTNDEHLAQIPNILKANLSSHRLILVNNAGLAVASPWELLETSRLRNLLEVNVIGAIMTTKTCLPFLRSNEGLVINMSSLSGLFSSPILGPYSVSKFALEAFSDSLRRELAPFGVSVSSVNPGPIKTPIWEKGLGDTELTKVLDDPIYGRSARRFKKAIDRILPTALDVSKVVEVVEKLSTAKHPRARTVVANPATRLIVFLARHLPARWVDTLVKRF